MGARELVLGVALVSLAACATASGLPKPRAVTPAERDSLSQEEEAADAMAVTLLNEAEASSCRALSSLLDARLRAPEQEVSTAWLHVHPVSAERIGALGGSCPGAASS